MKYETELYDPVRKYFTKQDYQVKGEVKNCDIIAYKEDEIVAIELKLHLNLDVILQAVERQKFAETVFIAIPALKRKEMTARFRAILHLLRRLEIGLLSVDKFFEVALLVEPQKFDRAKSMASNTRIRKEVVKEATTRKSNINEGGSSKVGIVTVYREKALDVAKELKKYTKLKPSHFIQMGYEVGIASILRKNHYGWFIKGEKGYYFLSEEGKLAIDSYKEIEVQEIFD